MKKLAKKENITKTVDKGARNELILILPILFLVTIYLFCVRGRTVPTYLEGFFWFNKGAYVGDLYTYFRLQVFMLVTIVFGVYMVFCMIMGELKVNKHKVYIPMIVYSVFVLISFVLSEYKDIALMGALERHEGTVALIFYMVTVFYAMNAVKSERSVKLIVKCFSIACVVLGVWGILQSFGVKLNSLPSWLYIPASLRGAAGISENYVTNAVTWFFSNQNYTSFFMIFPICIFAMSCIAQEDMRKKALYALLCGVMMFCLWQAASLGGMVGFAVAVVVAVIVAGAERINKWKKSLGLLILAAVISMGASLPVIMKEVKSGTVASDFFGFERAYATENSDAQLKFVTIDYIITDGEDIIFSFAGNEVTIATENGEVKSVLDSTGAEVAADRGLLTVSSHIDEESGYNIIDVRTAKYTWMFTVFNGEVFFFSPTGQGIKLDKVESIGFENNQRFATNRGYIWSRTLPLVKDTVLVGKGADTFAIYFPQDDYAGKYNIGIFDDGQNTIVDKPHNMYLGAAVNTGVISMIALIAVYVIYIIESFRIYRKCEFAGFKDYIGMGIFIAVAGFMVSALVNDSTVQIMPVVYVLLGTGFAINRMLKQ